VSGLLSLVNSALHPSTGSGRTAGEIQNERRELWWKNRKNTMKQWLNKLWEFLTESNVKKLGFIGAILAGLSSAVVSVSPTVMQWFSHAPAVVSDGLREGNDLLNIGQYAAAKRSFEQVSKADPQNTAAALGVKKAALWELTDAAEFEQKLHSLYAQYPDDAHLNVFMGKLFGANHNIDAALPYYQKALKLNPKLAEAYFDLGVLYEPQGKKTEAKKAYEQALEASSSTPKYRDNLAFWYFKQRDYDKAIALYGQNSNYPLSALGLAKIHGLRGEWQQAEALQRQALQLLKNDDGNPWYFEVAKGGVELIELPEKIDYAQLQLSLSLFMQGTTDTAQYGKLLSVKQSDVKAVMQAEVNQLARDTPAVASQLDAFSAQFLR
jgi:tetratricopeptide (TPR) repeat protein